MTTQPAALAVKPTADLTAFYYSTAPVFAAAMDRRDRATIRDLDRIEADLMACDAAAAEFDPSGDVSDLFADADAADRDWCASFDRDLDA